MAKSFSNIQDIETVIESGETVVAPEGQYATDQGVVIGEHATYKPRITTTLNSEFTPEVLAAVVNEQNLSNEAVQSALGLSSQAVSGIFAQAESSQQTTQELVQSIFGQAQSLTEMGFQQAGQLVQSALEQASAAQQPQETSTTVKYLPYVIIGLFALLILKK